jgi:hypothetical protein
MVYLYDACDQISDFCHQQLLRKMRRKISWTDGRTDGRTDRGKTVYPPLPSGSGGIHIKIVERGKICYPNTQIHDHSLSWFDAATSIKSGGVKLIVCAQTSPLCEMMWSCKCFPYVNKMPTLTYNWGNSVIIKNTIILNIIYNIFNFHFIWGIYASRHELSKYLNSNFVNIVEDSQTYFILKVPSNYTFLEQLSMTLQ